MTKGHSDFSHRVINLRQRTKDICLLMHCWPVDLHLCSLLSYIQYVGVQAGIMVRHSQVWSPEFWFSGRHFYISVPPVDVPATVVGLSHISTTGLCYYNFFYNNNYYGLCNYYTCTSFINIIIIMCWINLKCLAQWLEHALLNRETRVRSLPSTGRVLQNCRSSLTSNFLYELLGSVALEQTFNLCSLQSTPVVDWQTRPT